ncbi:carotenoid ester lipase precursor [Mycena latifolia]|nr:carotenoid ester lipase precursor [Mycena latifolia]
MLFAIFLITTSIIRWSYVTAENPPLVSLPYGTFQGLDTGNLTKFLGVPFAHAPRFETPKPPRLLHGVQNATDFGPACPQQALTPLPIDFHPGIYPSISEDCLTLDIFKPTASDSRSKLPVFVYIFGGGFEIGNSRDVDFSSLTERSIAVSEPVVVVAINYRVTAFGFLGGREVAAAGISNLGLRDQIYALEWVKKHISAFGGDPHRVVIGGQSAGAVSTSLLLLSNKQNSNALFRGAVMISGSPITSPSVTDGQAAYDSLVATNNCTASPDTLDCLRRVPFDSLMATVNKTQDLFAYGGLALVWRPRIDGDVIVEDPLVSVSRGLYAKIPIMTGDCDDEGTVFSLNEANITTNAEFLDYAHSTFLPVSSQGELARIGVLYPDDPTQGSPFNTGTANQLTPQYKRLSAFQGDIFFTAPRRFFLERASATQNAWSWLFARGKDTPIGANHGGDLPIWFPPNKTSDTTGADALINFINTLDPNHPAASSTIKPAIFWPKWNTPSSAGSPSLLTFSDPNVVNITRENFRVDAIRFLNEVLLREAGGFE